jgi:hypothetical protein
VLIHELTEDGDLQLIIATHSPLLMIYPGAVMISFSDPALPALSFEETSHYPITRGNLAGETVTSMFTNTGAQTAVFQVRSANPLQAPHNYTVSPNATLSDTWTFAPDGLAAYDLSVYGPNGFYRNYRGEYSS